MDLGINCAAQALRASLALLSAVAVLPCTAAIAAETELGKLAASMNPGEWVELKTTNQVETLRAKGNSGAIFGYNEGAVWDPTSRQVLYVGGDHNDLARFVAYAADENAWKVLPQPDWIGKHTSHGYDHNALDSARGVF